MVTFGTLTVPTFRWFRVAANTRVLRGYARNTQLNELMPIVINQVDLEM